MPILPDFLQGTFNFTLIRSIVIICISQLAYGFDNQGYASVQALDAFERQFGTFDPQTGKYGFKKWWLSLFNSLGFLSLLIGVTIGSNVSRRFGRRWCMFSMSLWALVSATISVTSKSSTQILVGRVLNYIYTGMELSVVPVYQSEITPRRARGFVVGTYQLCIGVGGLLINAICFGLQNRQDNSAWMIPLGLFYVIPVFVLANIWFIPESPRWLVLNGHTEKGLTALTRLRQGKFSALEIEEEFQAMIVSVNHEKEIEKGVWSDMFKMPNRRRTLTVFVINFFLQATGQAFASQYGALYIKSLGTVNQFQFLVILSSISIVISVTAMFLVDIVGRRNLLLFGGIVQATALFAMGGLGTSSVLTVPIKTAIVAMLAIFIIGYTIGWAPVVHTLSAEIPSASLRDQTYGTGAAISVLTNFTVAFTLPYLLYAPYGNLQSQVGFIYGTISVFAIIFGFLFVPDLRGRSLEDINRLFESDTPARKFHKVHLEPIVEVTKALDAEQGVVHHSEVAMGSK